MPSEPGPPDRVGPYRIEQRLGGGGMGVVFRGFDERLQRPVALKKIRRGIKGGDVHRRFRREARAIAQIDHSAIVRVHDWLERADGDWLVMELIEGRELAEVLEAEGPQPIGRVVAWGIEIASALGAAHEAGILHRDLKPENVMLTTGGKIKLLDFGLAKRLPTTATLESSTDESLTGEGRILGTVSAMSPEQALGEPLDQRSDLFALGSLLYRLLTGSPPFDGDSPMATMRAIVFEHPEPVEQWVANLPLALSRLIEGLLAKERIERPPDAWHVHSLLKELVPTLTPPVANESAAEQRREKRPITVLSVSLDIDSIPDSAAHHLMDLVPELDRVVHDVVGRWSGRFEGRMGDHWISCFGVPRAREDDARRTVHAGLEILTSARQALGPWLPDAILPVRVGVHSGEALVSSRLGAEEKLALGPTYDTATAIELQSSGHVLISAATEARVCRYFRLSSVEPKTARSRPSRRAFKVEAAEDLTAVVTEASVPLFGRHRELQILIDAFQHARDGGGRTVLLAGDPGIGKTRLLAQLRSRLCRESDSQAPSWLSIGGSRIGQSSPFKAVIDHLHKSFDLRPEDSPEQQVRRLELEILGLDLPVEELLPPLAALLGLPLGDRDLGSDLDPGLRKRRIQEALATLWIERAEQRSLILVIEDLQWLDPSTLEVLHLLVEQVPVVPMLLILSCRLSYESSWSQRDHVLNLRLERLNDDSVKQMVESVAGAPMPAEVTAEIAAKADGVPLYIEELTRAILESGQLRLQDGCYGLLGSLDRLNVPSTLQESLNARLDRLGNARSVAQLASVIGREFSRELLLRVGSLDGSNLDGTGLDENLERLSSADLVYRRGFGKRTRFHFRHALIQDAAYDSLLRSERRGIHLRVVDAMAELPASRRPPELLAHHLLAGGRPAEAVSKWHEASTMALQTSAYREAESHLRRALEAIAQMPAEEARDLAELGSMILMGRALSSLRGYSSREVEKVYGRAEELCERLGSEGQLLQVDWGLWAFYMVRSDLTQALPHSRNMLRRAERTNNTSDWLMAYSSLAVTHYFAGDLATAWDSAEAALQHDAANADRDMVLNSPQDLGVNALACQALIAWHRGEPTVAASWSERALSLAKSFSHVYSEVFAGTWGARLYQSRRQVSSTRRLADQVIELSEKHGFFWASQGWFFRGCALVQEVVDAHGEVAVGDVLEIPDRALEWMQRGVDAYRATGARLSISYMLAQLAEAHLWRGELQACREALQEAREAGGEGREGYWRPELYRLAGELELFKGRAGEGQEGARQRARENFHKALELADDADDVALGLRAHLSLARLEALAGERMKPVHRLRKALAVFDGMPEDGELLAARRLLARCEEMLNDRESDVAGEPLRSVH